MQVEVEERHAPHSAENAPATSGAPPTGVTGAPVPEGLDWQSFTAAYFPGRRRHDLQALIGYSAYRRSHAAGGRSSAEPPWIETGRGASAVRQWEDEGGTTLSADAA
jgi:hypothetical protein